MRPIDADALIEKCGEWYTEEGPEEGFIGTLKQLLDKQPTIEPKQGEWIDEDFNTFIAAAAFGFEVGLNTERPKGEWKDSYDASRICGIELKVCSVCGKEYYSELAKRFNFCPSCGARMKGADDD